MPLSDPRARFPWRAFVRAGLIQSLVVLLALGVSGLAARHFFKKQFIAQVERQLREGLVSVSRDLPARIQRDWCAVHAHDTSLRITLIERNGAVLCDSHRTPESMDNHGSRPEVAAALDRGFAYAIRYSDSVKEEMLYGALFLPERALTLRGATPLATLNETLRVFDRSLVLFLLGLALVMTALSLWSARRIVFPLGRLLVKAQDVLKRRESLAKEESTLERESGAYGEWQDLESSLENIRQDLVSKEESLDLERRRLETLLSSVRDAILAIDLQGNSLFFNAPFALLMGRTKLPDAALNLRELFTDPPILAAFRTALQEERPAAVSAARFALDAGDAYVSLSVSPLRDARGRVYGAVGIFHDVTELKTAEQMRIDFVANVSHELRTPLTAVRGYAETLKWDLTKLGRSEESGFAEIILRHVDRILGLVNDLLDLSTLESGASPIRKEILSTREVTDRVLTHMAPTFGKKNHSVVTRIEAPAVAADPRRLEQVLVNLLDNANKYTPQGGRISVSWEPADNDGVLLKVSDNGPGIPKEHRLRLFERFYRVDEARSHKIEGTGLGLAIVKHIMQKHEGEVWIESPPAGGATFVCRFDQGLRGL